LDLGDDMKRNWIGEKSWVIFLVPLLGSLAWGAYVTAAENQPDTGFGPIAVMGWNADIVLEQADHPKAGLVGGRAYVQEGFTDVMQQNAESGLRADRTYVSEHGKYCLEPYSQLNALVMTAANDKMRHATWTLSTPAAYQQLGLVGASSCPKQAVLQLNLQFADGSEYQAIVTLGNAHSRLDPVFGKNYRVRKTADGWYVEKFAMGMNEMIVGIPPQQQSLELTAIGMTYTAPSDAGWLMAISGK
jgi:hypothetical protein